MPFIRRLRVAYAHRFVWSSLFTAIALLGFSSSALAGRPNPGTLRIKTIPPKCIIMISDSVVKDFKEEGGWLQIKRPNGWYPVRVVGAGKVIEFKVQLQSKKKMSVTADLNTASVQGFSDDFPMPGNIPAKVVGDSTSTALPLENGPDYLPGPEEFVPVEVMPVALHKAVPAFPNPLLVLQDDVEGTVWIKALVDKEGSVREARIAKSSGSSSLDKAALEAATKYKYKPGIMNGQPLACWVTYPVTVSTRIK